ncbi:hypothetical protein ACNO7T_07170 [Vibrio campbellii]|uniref:hypothetical protein n=1 Tax=Vibrio TaxID=662 RepID=UPI000D39518C|nr:MULTISPECIES: hypothetical protein [Vibrio]MCG9562487.1 hypothetical protein [Vibrio chagasii]PTP15131.1 hypothetical protein CWO27_08175 [Vibrio sp. 10N.286.51.C3]TKE73426.1 hypothetical protein FCV45_04085 [Vibrio sp. F12]CAK3652317.1 TIGR04255 family protein [Vibrio crassostreae]
MEQVIKLQLALFFESYQMRPDNLMHSINSDMGNLFDAMPQIIPMPEDAPLDIPRVQLRSENNRYNCNIAPSRVDFIINGNGSNESSWVQLTNDFLAKLRLFVRSVNSKAASIRFGLIGNFFIPDNVNSASITRKYLKVDLNSAEEINLRFNKRNSLYGLNLNNITSINTVIAEINNVPNKGVFIELDINNVPDNRRLDIENLIELVSKQLPNFAPEKVKGLVK